MVSERIETLRNLMLQALSLRGIGGEAGELIVEDYLGAQIEGKYTHGLGKFLLIDSALAERVGAPAVIRKSDTYALIDGNRELGHVAAMFAVDLLVSMARDSGIAMVGMINCSRYGRLKVFGETVAREGLVGILMNNAGPGAVTPHNGIDPILGTNPICFAFPTANDPLVFDFSTSKRVWGEIRQATLEGRTLPEGAFLDSSGQPTCDPSQAEAVLPFGGPKGYALCLAVEILSGALVSAKMGKDVDSQYDLGFLFLAIDPSVFGAGNAFRAQVDDLARDIRASRPADPGIPVCMPGDTSRRNRLSTSATGMVAVDKQTFDRLVEMSTSLGGGIGSNNKVD